MKKPESELLAEIENYYSDKLDQHGATPQGVDWNGESSQTLRFQQLCKIISAEGPFSVNDLGCGYGALFEFLAQDYTDFSYTGCDLSASMIRAAKERHPNLPNAKFEVDSEPREIADFGIASGIFNVRLDRTDAEWRDYLESTLEILDRTSLKGFAFNCLTSYSDPEKMRPYLYYADPCAIFDLCKRRFSPQVALLHDYGLFEFTLLVRKES